MSDDRKRIASNRKAFGRFEIQERFEAGVELLGSEVKSLREGRTSLGEGYARFSGDELYLLGVNISPYGPSGESAHEPTRRRKLLLTRRELDRLAGKVAQKGYTLLPLSMYFKRGWAKVEVGLARARKKWDKREKIEKKRVRREMAKRMGRK